MNGTDRRIGVLHLIDSLAVGGAERMAVNLVNALPRERYRPFLATTRSEGLLEAAVRPDVGRLRLARRGRFDLQAIRQLSAYVRQHQIQIVHAHSSSIFIATAARELTARSRQPALLWHDHYGRHDTDPRRKWLYRWPVRRASGVIAVNPQLAAWSRNGLGVRGDRVWYLRNFVLPREDEAPAPTLPGREGSRIVCVANFRHQKDHTNLVQAMAEVAAREPRAHLLLIGTGNETRLAVEQFIKANNLDSSITILGHRSDVPAVLRACDVGVLASSSEGLPLALLEYSQAGLATVSTEVGECAEVLDAGQAGVLVPPKDPGALSDALITMLGDPSARATLGKRLRQRVASVYGVPAAIEQLEACYRAVLPPGEPST